MMLFCQSTRQTTTTLRQTKLRSHFLFTCLILALTQAILPTSLQAAPSIFKAVLQEDIFIERAYESYDLSFVISGVVKNNTAIKNQALKGKILNGTIALNTVTGQLIIEIHELLIDEVPLEAIGYAEGKDKTNGIAACKLWKTRMFEDSKLCYAAEAKKGTTFKLIVTVNEEVPPEEIPPEEIDSNSSADTDLE